ncbi:MAG: 3-oxoacyl-ACP reductase FabG [Planctomycetota bacterium]
MAKATETPEHRVAVVTGASRGIGRAIATRLARPAPEGPGRHVVLVARSEAPLNDLKAEIEANGGLATVRAADIGDRAAWTETLEGIASELGRLDILVNNAGITRDNLILRMSDEEWDEVINVNLTSAFVGMRAVSRTMMKQRFGRIVNIASTTAIVGNSGQANYAAAKGGLIAMTKTIARELGGKGVTANIVAPGFIATDMTADLPAEVTETVQRSQAVRRIGEPNDIAAAVAYSTSDDAGFLTGQVITVDGGLTMA